MTTEFVSNLMGDMFSKFDTTVDSKEADKAPVEVNFDEAIADAAGRGSVQAENDAADSTKAVKGSTTDDIDETTLKEVQFITSADENISVNLDFYKSRNNTSTCHNNIVEAVLSLGGGANGGAAYSFSFPVINPENLDGVAVDTNVSIGIPKEGVVEPTTLDEVTPISTKSANDPLAKYYEKDTTPNGIAAANELKPENLDKIPEFKLLEKSPEILLKHGDTDQFLGLSNVESKKRLLVEGIPVVVTETNQTLDAEAEQKILDSIDRAEEARRISNCQSSDSSSSDGDFGNDPKFDRPVDRDLGKEVQNSILQELKKADEARRLSKDLHGLFLDGENDSLNSSFDDDDDPRMAVPVARKENAEIQKQNLSMLAEAEKMIALEEEVAKKATENGQVTKMKTEEQVAVMKMPTAPPPSKSKLGIDSSSQGAVKQSSLDATMPQNPRLVPRAPPSSKRELTGSAHQKVRGSIAPPPSKGHPEIVDRTPSDPSDDNDTRFNRPIDRKANARAMAEAVSQNLAELSCGPANAVVEFANVEKIDSVKESLDQCGSVLNTENLDKKKKKQKKERKIILSGTPSDRSSDYDDPRYFLPIDRSSKA